MVSGIGLGGIATGFQRQEALNNQQNYEQGLLQLEQQRLQQQEKNQQRVQYMQLRSQAISDMQNTVTAVKNAHPDWSETQVLSFPALTHQRDMLSGFDKNLGLDPNGAQSILAGMVAGKSQIETDAATARAKASATGELGLRSAQTQEAQARAKLLSDDGGGGDDSYARGVAEYKLAPPNTSNVRSPQAIKAAEQFMRKVYAINPDYDAKNYKVEQQASTADVRADSNTLTKLVQTRESIQQFEDTAVKNGDTLVELAKKVDKTGIPVIERWTRAGRQGIEGDADVSNFNIQLQFYRAEVAKVITNPNLSGQLTDSARNEVAKALQDGASFEQIKRAHELIKKDFANRSKSIDDRITSVRDRLKSAGKSEKKETVTKTYKFNPDTGELE